MTEQLEIAYTGEYFYAFIQEKKPKTNVYAITSKSAYDRIGIVKWYPPWRQYCFYPENDTVWSRKCLQEVHDFIRKIMELRKK